MTGGYVGMIGVAAKYAGYSALWPSALCSLSLLQLIALCVGYHEI